MKQSKHASPTETENEHRACLVDRESPRTLLTRAINCCAVVTLWAIADLHASSVDPATGRPKKPMDTFGPQWTDHMDRLEVAWDSSVGAGDTVVIAGDIDWALHLDDAMFTLDRLDGWKGTKLLIRGNHDYWWSSKTTNKVRGILPPSIRLIHNDSVVIEDVNVCGSKGSPVPGGIDWTPVNEKLLQRELHRLHLSLDSRVVALQTIVALHFPPYYPGFGSSHYKESLEQYGVGCCVYGHLHGEAAGSGPSGIHNGVEYRLVAGDYVNFEPVPIWDGGLVTDARRVVETGDLGARQGERISRGE